MDEQNTQETELPEAEMEAPVVDPELKEAMRRLYTTDEIELTFAQSAFLYGCMITGLAVLQGDTGNASHSAMVCGHYYRHMSEEDSKEALVYVESHMGRIADIAKGLADEFPAKEEADEPVTLQEE